METPVFCKHCKLVVELSFYFCPNCGKKLRNKPVSLGFFSLVWLLILSALLPPLGIGKTVAYLRDESLSAKVLGIISLVITIASLVIAVRYTQSMVNEFTRELNAQLGVLGL